jgi:hypothetical protein
MKPPPEEPLPDKDEPPTQETPRIIEEHANALRKVIKKAPQAFELEKSYCPIEVPPLSNDL